jgi:tetratricopeptide (TPR) repeat protein
MRLLAFLFVLGLSGCSVFNHDPIRDLGDPDVRLEALLDELYDARAKERGEMDEEDPAYDDTRPTSTLLRELETLAFDFPDHAPTRYACGAAAYAAGQRHHAEAHLDAALAADPRLTDAASLRARLSIEEGNYPRAARLVEDGLLLAPDSADLVLLRAQLLDLSGDAEGALAAIDLAQRLGTEEWRADYHRALVFENQGLEAQAEEALRRSLAANPGFEPAQSRLNRLEAR